MASGRKKFGGIEKKSLFLCAFFPFSNGGPLHWLPEAHFAGFAVAREFWKTAGIL
jgi:hypothetical protein